MNQFNLSNYLIEIGILFLLLLILSFLFAWNNLLERGKEVGYKMLMLYFRANFKYLPQCLRNLKYVFFFSFQNYIHVIRFKKITYIFFISNLHNFFKYHLNM